MEKYNLDYFFSRCWIMRNTKRKIAKEDLEIKIYIYEQKGET